MRQNTLLVIFLIALLDLVGFGMLLPILPFAVRDQGGTLMHYGLLMSAFSGVQFLMSPFWGRVSDSWGRRPIILINLFGTCIAFTLLGLAGNLHWFFIARVMAGIFGGTLSTAYAYVFDIMPANERGKGFGMISAASGLSLVFGPAIGGTLMRYGFAAPVFLAAAMALFNLFFAAFMLSEHRLASQTRSANRYKRFDPETLQMVLENPQARMASGMLFLITLALSQIECVVVVYLWNRFLYDSELTGVILALMNLVILVVQARFQPPFTRRHGYPWAISAGAFVGAASLLIFINSGVQFILTCALLVFALGQGLMMPSIGAWAAEPLPPERRMLGMGVVRTFGSCGRILGPMLAGWMFERMSWRTPFLFSLALCLAVGTFGLLWLVLHLRRPAAVRE